MAIFLVSQRTAPAISLRESAARMYIDGNTITMRARALVYFSHLKLLAKLCKLPLADFCRAWRRAFSDARHSMKLETALFLITPRGAAES